MRTTYATYNYSQFSLNRILMDFDGFLYQRNEYDLLHFQYSKLKKSFIEKCCVGSESCYLVYWKVIQNYADFVKYNNEFFVTMTLSPIYLLLLTCWCRDPCLRWRIWRFFEIFNDFHGSSSGQTLSRIIFLNVKVIYCLQQHYNQYKQTGYRLKSDN